jgi:FixJ family two-component response regulator
MSKAPQVLFVDDEEFVLNAIQRHFLDEDYQLHTATSGRAALALLETTPCDVVVSDFRMPQMNGGEFLREVCHRWPETVRIVLSGYADISAVISAINDGAIFKFVTKPWHENELRDAVREAVEKHHSTVELRELAELALRANEGLIEQDQISKDSIHRRNLDLEEWVTSLGVFRDAFRAAPVPLLIFDNQARVVEINPAARAVLATPGGGSPRDDVVPRIPQWLLENAAATLQGESSENHGHLKVGEADGLLRARFALICHENGMRGVVAALIAF